MNDNNKKIIKTSVLAISVFAIILSVTYAFINITLQGEKKQVITTGNLDLVLDEDENNLTITNALPMYDEVGMMQDAFTFRIINNTTIDTNYILKLTNITTGDALDKTIVKYGLTKNGVGEPALLSTLPDDGTVDSGIIGNKEIIEYSLRLWIDSSVTANSVISGKTLSYRVDLDVNQKIEEIRFVDKLEELAQESTADFPDFKQVANATNNNGQGIYKYQEDGEDIYYWRGVVNDNNVIFAGYCWQMVRTTKTGGIKMIYNGEVVEPVLDENNNVIGGKCTNTGTATVLRKTTAFNSSSKSPAYVGYMYGNTVYEYQTKTSSDAALKTAGILYGYDVNWTGTEYELKAKDGGSLFSSTGTWSNDRKSVGNGNHYTCFDSDGKCETVSYVYYTGSGSYPYYIDLTGGTTIEKALEQMYSNEKPSTIKTNIETWFESTDLDEEENLSKLEDVVYCNDRSVTDTNHGWNKDGDASKYMYYSSYTRRSNGTPDLSCSNNGDNRDRFTYKDTVNGNGLLKWPVGLLSADEIILAGGQESSNSDYYLYTEQNYWAFSPYNFDDDYAGEFVVLNPGYLNYGLVYASVGVRPVVSLRTGISFASGGNGTKEKPYIVE